MDLHFFDNFLTLFRSIQISLAENKDMNQLIVFMALIIASSCAQRIEQNSDITNVGQINKSEIVNKRTTPESSYQVTFEIDSSRSPEPRMIISIDIFDKDFLESPHANGYYTDSSTLLLDENSKLVLKDSLETLQKSIESTDPWGHGRVNLVRRNSTFAQKLILKSPNDFEVSGTFSFVLAPEIDLQEVKFMIKNRSGNLVIEKLNTSIPFIK